MLAKSQATHMNAQILRFIHRRIKIKRFATMEVLCCPRVLFTAIHNPLLFCEWIFLLVEGVVRHKTTCQPSDVPHVVVINPPSLVGNDKAFVPLLDFSLVYFWV